MLAVGSKRQEFARFLVAGAVNTALTYGALVAAMRWLDYRVAYTLVYVAGIALSYWLQSRYVFRVPFRWRAALQFPLVYVVQYLAGVAVLWVLVEEGLRKEIAALVAILVNVPLGFLLSRGLLKQRHHRP